MESTGSSSEVGAIWQDIEEGLREQAARLRSDLTLSLQENRELKERLMVSEATVHAQAEQLKDYRDLLSEFVISTVACAHILRSRCANILKKGTLCGTWNCQLP